jgi:hypothetical protein
MARAEETVPVVWEINSPADENLAFSWLGGKRSGVRESWVKWLKRWFHAARQKPRIAREEKVRRALAERVDGAICVSSSMGNYAKNHLGIEHAVVVPNGGPLIPEEEIHSRRQKRDNKTFTVFYSGSAIYPWQGLDMLSGVIELAKTEAPDIRFLLAVNQRSDYLPEGDNVEIKERVPRDEVLDIIAATQNTTVSFKIIPQIYDVVSGHKTEEVIGHPLLRLFPSIPQPGQSDFFDPHPAPRAPAGRDLCPPQCQCLCIFCG